MVNPIAADMGDCLFTAMDMEYTELVAPGYYATTGYGVPSGLGVQAATGRRPLILVGDGAFQMTALEQAFEDDTCFQLIDISLACGLMSNTLSRFVAGFKQMRDG